MVGCNLSKLTGYNTDTMEGWIDKLKAESGTKCRRDYLAWAIKHGYIDRI